MNGIFYFDVLKAFHDEGVKYLLVGGVAANLHGVERATHDIDIIISMNKTNVMKVDKVLKSLGYLTRLPGIKAEDLSNPEKRDDWIKNKNLKAFSYYHPSAPYKVLDIVIEHPIDFDEAFKRKESVKAEGIKVNIISISDLVKMKKFSGREQDLSDVKYLNRIQKLNSDEKEK